MNGTEQSNHKRKTDALAADLATIAEASADGLTLLRSEMKEVEMRGEALTLALIGEERTHRLKLANEQRDYVDRHDSDLWVALNTLRLRGFWSRLNWLLTGR